VAVPIGAYGLPLPLPPPPEPDPRSWTRGEGGRLEPVLGGEAVVRQAAAIVRESVEAKRTHDAAIAVELRRRSYWARREAWADEQLKTALSESVAPRDGETEDQYDARLTAIFENLRLRIDGGGSLNAIETTVPAPAPVTRVQTDLPNSTNAFVGRSPFLPLLRREAKRLRREFWARNHRRPTAEEFAALVAADRRANGYAPR
jgi:hypothetical protein